MIVMAKTSYLSRVVNVLSSSSTKKNCCVLQCGGMYGLTEIKMELLLHVVCFRYQGNIYEFS